MSASDDIEAQKRAYYRLGVLDSDSQDKLESALTNF